MRVQVNIMGCKHCYMVESLMIFIQAVKVAWLPIGEDLRWYCLSRSDLGRQSHGANK
jgi:hypothetical protein